MTTSQFDDAVVLWLDPRRPEFGVKLVEDVPTALDALHRHGLEECIRGPQSQLWTSAASALVQADVEPSPKNRHAAYEAFLRLVKRTAPVPTTVRLRVAPRGLRERVEALFITA